MTPELVFLAMYIADGMPLSFFNNKISMMLFIFQGGTSAEGASVTWMVQESGMTCVGR
ncbi:hypothetical protein [Halomonas marinisediminis]|uniref:hypothetical protein n=1 Tax=Halomonas marinisediminis TaxID=2546095 RepID=UPI00140448F0|nr:hypothetical protein [Halomonas marinisediminis]